MARSFKEDFSFGTKQEDLILPRLKQFFEPDIVKSESHNSIYDYKGTNYYYELKSRNVGRWKYSTTMLGVNKVFATNHIFLFNFTDDGLYYIEYNKTLFDSFVKKEFKRCFRTDINDKPKLYYYIPIEELLPVKDSGNWRDK
jgi:hypothetical protein